MALRFPMHNGIVKPKNCDKKANLVFTLNNIVLILVNNANTNLISSF